MEQTALNIIWGHIVDRIRKSGSLSTVACDQWLATVTPLSLDDTKLTLGTPNGFILKWIKDRYLPHLEKAAFDIVGEKCTIFFHNLNLTPKDAPLPDLPAPKGKHKRQKAKPSPSDHDAPMQTTLMDSFQGVDENLPADIDTIATEAITLSAESEESYAVRSSVDRVAPGDTSSLNPKYTFDTFVTGNSNRFAHAAALAVAKSPGRIYNPFFLYGGVGLGKTHLMHAIGHEILKNFPDKRVLYVSSEKFTNELINAIKDGDPESFRQKYRTIDVLLVDDIQFLSKKPSTQEEFFHTFNTLHDSGHAIILSSDRAPHNVEHLAERLRSRFEWGLTADVQAPDFETRIAILKKKAQLDNLNVPNEVMVSIANSVDTNIRELEGALTRIVAYASITHQPITVAVAEKTIENIFPKNRSRRVTPELIKNVVANHFKIQVSDLDSKNRSRNIVYPRNVAIYLCREMTDTSFPQIGTLFGGKDHSTILHAYNKVKNTIDSDQSMNNTIQKLIDQIQNS